MSQPAPADYHDEDWYRTAGNLSTAERMRRITAVTLLMDGADRGLLNDTLYSELAVMLEALQGDDLRDASTYPAGDTMLKYLEEFGESLSDLAGEFDLTAESVRSWTDSETALAGRICDFLDNELDQGFQDTPLLLIDRANGTLTPVTVENQTRIKPYQPDTPSDGDARK